MIKLHRKSFPEERNVLVNNQKRIVCFYDFNFFLHTYIYHVQILLSLFFQILFTSRVNDPIYPTTYALSKILKG